MKSPTDSKTTSQSQKNKAGAEGQPSRRLSLSGKPSLRHEEHAGFPLKLVAGLDEVGRGCLAGPVVAGALVLPELVDFKREPWLKEIRDSKLLDPETREELAPKIAAWARAWAIGEASVEEIDRINIYHASHLAMCRAFEGLSVRPGHALVDGNVVPKALRCPSTAIVKGDLKCLSIAAASILAKVHRDRLMRELDERFPGYGFASHKGYSTPAHSVALRELKPCAIHRRSFEPVATLLGLSAPAPAQAAEEQPEFSFDA